MGIIVTKDAKKDLQLAFNKVKDQGWIMGHDYEMNMIKAPYKLCICVQTSCG
jgi:hypothetical protein